MDPHVQKHQRKACVGGERREENRGIFGAYGRSHGAFDASLASPVRSAEVRHACFTGRQSLACGVMKSKMPPSPSSVFARAFATIWLMVGVLALAFVPGCQNYDQLVDKDQTCEQRWSDYEAQLQRRSDLVPNLVAIVKASAKHESDTLAKVTEARASATGIKLTGDDFTDPAKMAAFQKAQDQLKGSLSRLLVANEAYPELKANQAFRDLSVQIEGSENRILRAREQYNEAVKIYNTELKKIRGQVVNKATGKPFKERVYFSASAEAQGPAPKVSF